VYALKAYFVNGLTQHTYKSGDYFYGWKVYNAFKIYRPLANKADKWRSSLTAYDLQGFEQLEADGDLLIITKALKDVMLLRELGYNAIAPPSESTGIPEIIMNNLKKRFKRIVIFYDNDAAGFKNSELLKSEYSLDSIVIPANDSKDISDYFKANGKEKTIELLNSLIS
jgi:hypothetical protein